ncbi:hypothetical protein IQ235_15795 [Oscillatoriales cyanobacterium LEGE 11467]|uniref:Uncharacterized protein n=1 Tax=Zarconia navalis LEGE 11467 TaxID=1828826 RepID=A0A928W1H2_9CYAN|nr:hypothetical protein [Zarconia navalis]MBE9042241.1 hypothetical protein [Zarconia navalis LEGE 11467]
MPVYSRSRKATRSASWFEKVMALLAAANLGLVLFDLSYIPYRDLYVRCFYIREVCLRFPKGFHKTYDRLKGIEPHRDTQGYLQTVDRLKAQVRQTGLDSREVDPILADLRQMSREKIDDNPFARANKIGALEKIKNLIRVRIFDDRGTSSKDAFARFWTRSYLTQNSWQEEIGFFDRQIRPLMETNYFRHYGETGELINKFWWFDLYFNIIFFLEFLARTWFISRRNIGVKWFPDAMLWRWYDVFLFLPFSIPLPLFTPFWSLLRVIPVAIRLDRTNLLNLDSVWQQINRGVVANFAEALTEMVVIRIIDQIQYAIQNDLPKWLDTSERRDYIDLNNVNEVEALSTRFVNLSVYEVWPKIQPDIEALLHHNITKNLKSIPIYQGLENIPGLSNVPDEIVKQLVSQMTQTVYETLTATLKDPVGAQLTNQLIEHFSESFAGEVQKPKNISDIQGLVFDFLEEFKINYVKRMEEEDFERILAETQRLNQIVKR